ncbi:dentin sialophosphoprotein [Helicoverpa zea]|uniref:dentin sialophosphoprotein n=1 Tax=Helicoverpa zea TaxID=7113 RepID=UPI001F56D76F|nr:dentin sialophosphoprotein [Helicoverpa zea]
MKRVKRHKVKTEAPETSTSHNRDQENHDLAYYIHDRVELMHQVFSVIKYKELKAMVPASIRNISIDDLQELCTEELLGISSKRLCAILDGAEPPSDTESSSPSPPPEQMETISLDSISSDDEILSQSSSKKKKHKHRRHSKSKSKRKKSKEEDQGSADKSKASRAGLTVLELLELQARARAIRAQLQQEQRNKPPSEPTQEPPHSSDNEVEIKEEPAEVVEISSDDEKPKIEDLQKKINQEKEPDLPQPQATVTKQVNDLIITVPKSTKQKIKLNRNKSISSTDNTTSVASNSVATNEKSVNENVATAKNSEPTTKSNTEGNKNVNKKDKGKKKKKDKKKDRKDDIDNDEITLQLSDTEKMDLLEDLDRKNYDSVSSCSDSSSDSSDSDDDKKDKGNSPKETPATSKDNEENTEKVTIVSEKIEKYNTQKDLEAKDDECPNIDTIEVEKEEESNQKLDQEDCSKNTKLESSENDNNTEKGDKMDTGNEEIHSSTEIIETNPETELNIAKDKDISEKDQPATLKDVTVEGTDIIKDINTIIDEENNSQTKDTDNNMSEGELSDRESSEVEAVDLKPEVVCISDEEGSKKSKKKKKKKDKKAKKDKKTKKKDFRESADQNFFKNNDGNTSENEIENPRSIEVIDNTTTDSGTDKNVPTTEKPDKVDLTTEKTEKENKTLSDDDIEAVYEIMELSDDSSCCEVEFKILSKEPTTSEIEALSAKIDEIEREEIITEKEIIEYERQKEQNDLDSITNLSWKDRYLDSAKVKKVLNTANILNAIRKKNIELKKKLAESKNDGKEAEKEIEIEKEKIDNIVLEEGTIEQYNTLETSNKYVDPVKEVSKDLKKDAKLLLKMYKKLLKYNDMNKPENPNKQKRKKKKKVKKDSKNKDAKDTVVGEVESCNSEVNVLSKDDIPQVSEELNNLN